MSVTSFNELYSGSRDIRRRRYDRIINSFSELYKTAPARFFSASGRTEIGGNHTDHNQGKVLAAAVDLDVAAAVIPTDDGIITVKSEGFPEDRIDTSRLEPVKDETNSSAALIRGVCAGLKNKGFNVGGFTAYTSSEVLKGSGLSSSAAFEVLIGTILNHLYNNGEISDIEIAKIAQYSENVYFGKPSGLMDQMASSVGGFISIDFKDLESPVIDAIDFDLNANGCSLCIIDTKADHADLTDEYSAIPGEMKSVAVQFNKSCLREITKEDVIKNVSMLRKSCGDRAVLRALHFFDENERVNNLSSALKSGDFESFLKYINRSGESSYKYLQNVFAASDVKNQAVSLALYLCESLLDGEGASRVHGGGFAGTVQAFVPNKKLPEFKKGIEAVFGEGSMYILNIRPVGGTEVIL